MLDMVVNLDERLGKERQLYRTIMTITTIQQGIGSLSFSRVRAVATSIYFRLNMIFQKTQENFLVLGFPMLIKQ